MEFAILVIGIIVYFIIKVVISSGNRQDNETKRAIDSKAQDSFIGENNINVTSEYTFKLPDSSISVRYIADNKNKKVYIADTSESFNEIPFSEIIGCDILRDSEVVGGVKRAVVGGVLAGEAGAIVGAATAKKKITSYKIIINRENIETPKTEIRLLNRELATDTRTYSEMVSFATSVSASIKAIMSSQTKKLYNNATSRNNALSSVADELIKLKTLMDDGVITDAEFNAQKKKLLEGNNYVSSGTLNSAESKSDNNNRNYKLLLVNAGPNKVKVIKTIREITSVGLKEANVIIDSSPSVIIRNCSYSDAMRYKDRFEELDASVRVEME